MICFGRVSSGSWVALYTDISGRVVQLVVRAPVRALPEYARVHVGPAHEQNLYGDPLPGMVEAVKAEW